MNRYDELKKILDEGEFFKLVCGAGNEDPDEVYKLTLVYAIAGATAIDISANVDVVKSAVKALDKSYEIADKLKRSIRHRLFITVSVGLKGDPHVRKAKINKDICNECGNCIEECLQNAIDEEYNVLEQKCIGCGKCEDVCGSDAIKYYTRQKNLSVILPECIKHGAENVELHAIIPEDEKVMKDWKLINTLVPDNYISMCLDRSQLSNKHLLERIQDVYNITGERLIIQADGAPMSGGKDDYNTTLQTVAIADVIRKSGIPVMVIASGGTNSLTGKLAKSCGVKINGVSLGTYARKIVSEFIRREDFLENISLIENAVKVAEKLIKDNIGG